MRKKLLVFTILSLLAMTVTSCVHFSNPRDRFSSSNKDSMNSINSSENNSSSNHESTNTNSSVYEIPVEEDIYGMLPDNVKNANISIDLLIYIEGQEGRIPDIGNYSVDPAAKTRYHPEDISSIEMAKWFGAASAFKKLVPGVEINLMYCTTSQYPGRIRQYREQEGHLPHLMWGSDHVFQMLSNGYNYDLTRYKDSPYYSQYNDYFMSRFNLGGFQAGFPISAEPWGVLVNATDLEEYGLISQVVNSNTGRPSSEYREWVENFDWETLMNVARQVTNKEEHHAGLSKVVEYFTSYSVASINEQFIRDGSVDFTSPEVIQTIEKLLNYENELSQYCTYIYDETSTGNTKDPNFPNAANWDGTNNFVRDQYSTFYAEAPWAVGTISQRVSTHNKEAAEDTTGEIQPINDRFDYLPYPKLDADSKAYTGIAVEGLTIGNQCPLGTQCTNDKQLAMDVAAYFAMFTALDPRSIEARSTVKYIFNNEEYVGEASFPLSKLTAKFKWQNDPELAADDPAADYDSNWRYQMAKWFEVYDLYTTNDEVANVYEFTNVMPGLVTMLDSIYAIPGIGEDDYVTCLDFWNEPVDVIDYETNSTRNFFTRWQGRFTQFGSKVADNLGAGNLGTATYVSQVMGALADMQEDINTNAEIAWAYLQECVDSYYEEGKYNVLDRTNRNNYEGHI